MADRLWCSVSMTNPWKSYLVQTKKREKDEDPEDRGVLCDFSGSCNEIHKFELLAVIDFICTPASSLVDKSVWSYWTHSATDQINPIVVFFSVWLYHWHNKAPTKPLSDGIIFSFGVSRHAGVSVPVSLSLCHQTYGRRQFSTSATDMLRYLTPPDRNGYKVLRLVPWTEEGNFSMICYDA